MKRKLARALQKPFPDEMRTLLARRLTWWGSLDHDEQGRMEDLIQLFLADKRVEGVVGYELPDEVPALIAAQACLLILGLEFDFYADVSAVVVSPTRVTHRGERRLDVGVVTQDHAPLAGQAMLHGPVLIVWDRAQYDARHPERGRNVIFHEFAHKLDMRDGSVDGVPPLTRQLAETWSPQMATLLARIRSGETVAIDAYAATNPSELLSVATEAFFVLPVELAASEPGLYRLLQEFYRQDPAARMRRTSRESEHTMHPERPHD